MLWPTIWHMPWWWWWWQLPLAFHALIKVLVIIDKYLYGMGLWYLMDCHSLILWCCLWGLLERTLYVPQMAKAWLMRTREAALSVIALQLWKDFPGEGYLIPSLSSFKGSHKTVHFLFLLDFIALICTMSDGFSDYFCYLLSRLGNYFYRWDWHGRYPGQFNFLRKQF